MELRDYLHKHRIKIVDFAKKINYQRSYVNNIVTGTKKPGKKFAIVVQEATNGEVTINDLIGKGE